MEAADAFGVDLDELDEMAHVGRVGQIASDLDLEIERLALVEAAIDQLNSI